MKVSDEQACRILFKVFYNLGADEPLLGHLHTSSENAGT